jgi:hypothetical protein
LKGGAPIPVPAPRAVHNIIAFLTVNSTNFESQAVINPENAESINSKETAE